MPPPGVQAPQHLLEKVHFYEVPFVDEHGEYILDSVHAQDIMAWITQGPIADRTREALGATDRGITMLRRMLLRELKRIEEGHDPKMTFRDPAQNETIQVPVERTKAHRGEGFENMFRRHEARYSSVAEDIVRLFTAQPAEPVRTGA